MSDRKRTREREDRRDHKRHKSSKQDLEKLKTQTKKLNQEVQKLKHVETFYEKPPPGLIKESEEKPEDCIPAEPGNEEARSFLAHAPTKGLWMPLGKEVKVMQCWRCKRYGHRTGDRECPFFIKGNQKLEQFRVAHEDPMYDIIRENKRNEKETRERWRVRRDFCWMRRSRLFIEADVAPVLILILLLLLSGGKE
ncbi:retinitis pigmentosa 9 protein isoform X2 [Toxotes jaculatrix]|uniref:retinitis pigmentosa 9 protein isoform X2 n=1 Tax=Toxotes jaculatrix TaxID=941984 RepID=UPI001B3A96DC|nr:retinitis pigmentosa 9 protein isoform X2 [Toxotes jaculatrix]